MSHVAKVDLKIRDLDALEEACERIGLELVRGQSTYKWYGRFMNDWSNAERAAAMNGHDPSTFGHCTHAIRVKGNPNAYEIGLRPALDGDGFDLLYDAWSGGMGLEKVAGGDLSEVKDHYAASLAQKRLRRQGYRTTLRRNQHGKLQLAASKS